MIHGDLHTGNWMIEKVDDHYQICIIDWDAAHKSWFLIDLATIVFGTFAGAKMFEKQIGEAKVQETARNFTNWVC
jgi:thiamine kinase-like enzyme